MPAHLAARELEDGTLKVLALEGGSTHVFRPTLYWRVGRPLGPAAKRVVEVLTGGETSTTRHR